jgi:hypothetical protein
VEILGRNNTVNEFDNVILTCKSVASPSAQYYWTVPDKAAIELANRQTYRLVMEKITRNHAGRYMCTASNYLGSENSSTMALFVKCKLHLPLFRLPVVYIPTYIIIYIHSYITFSLARSFVRSSFLVCFEAIVTPYCREQPTGKENKFYYNIKLIKNALE